MSVRDLRAVFPGVSYGVLATALARNGGDAQLAAEDVLRSQEGQHHPPHAPTTTTTRVVSVLGTPPAASVVPRGDGSQPTSGGGGGGGGGVNAAARRRVAEILPHVESAAIDAALARHNGGFTADDEARAVECLLNSCPSDDANEDAGGGRGAPGAADAGRVTAVAQRSATSGGAGVGGARSDAAASPTAAGLRSGSRSDRISATHITTSPRAAPAVGTPVAGPPPSVGGSSPSFGNGGAVPHAGASSYGARPPAHLPPTAALSCGAPPPRLSGRRKALLIGVNYVGTAAALRGCHNDVAALFGVLTQKYGWSPECIHALVDDGRRGPAGEPTRGNIVNAMRWLSQDAAPGDVLFFAFSGHGAQRPDPNGVEEDGMNETILPSDWETAGMITDDEIGALLVHTLPDGVRLTALVDSCHSGTGLDLPFTLDPSARGGWKWREETNPYHSLGDVQMISGCEDGDVSCDASSLYGAPGGAMTTAFCEVMRRHSAPTYPELLSEMHRSLRRRGMPQRPQLSSSQRVDVDRPFLLDDVCSNGNPVIGRTFRRRFPPRPRRGFEGSPLGGMLGLGAAVVGGLVVGDMIGDALAGGIAAEGVDVGGMFDGLL